MTNFRRIKKIDEYNHHTNVIYPIKYKINEIIKIVNFWLEIFRYFTDQDTHYVIWRLVWYQYNSPYQMKYVFNDKENIRSFVIKSFITYNNNFIGSITRNDLMKIEYISGMFPCIKLSCFSWIRLFNNQRG